jgi:hypothetical protein
MFPVRFAWLSSTLESSSTLQGRVRPHTNVEFYHYLQLNSTLLLTLIISSLKTCLVRPRPSRPQPSRLRPSRAQLSRPQPSRPQPSRAQPSRPQLSRPQPSRPRPSRPQPSRPQPSRVRPY